MPCFNVNEYNASTTEKVAHTINYVDMMAVRHDPRDGHIKYYMPPFLTVCAGMSWHNLINLPTDEPSGDPRADVLNQRSKCRIDCSQHDLTKLKRFGCQMPEMEDTMLIPLSGLNDVN